MRMTFKQYMISMAVALLGFTVCTAQSQAPVYTANVALNNQTAVNTCTDGELVSLNGTVQFSYSVSTDASGVSHFSLTAANTLIGSGQTSGKIYNASDSTNYTVNTSDGQATFTADM